MATALDSEKALEACKKLAEELTRATGHMTLVRLQLDIAKYTGADVDAFLAGLDDLQDRACRVAYNAGIVSLGLMRQLERRRRQEAMQRLGAPRRPDE